MTDIELPVVAPIQFIEALDETASQEEVGLSREQFESTIKAIVDDAVFYIDNDVAPSREKAMKYYRGDPFGNEEEGRSRIVMTEVQDTVQAMLPSLVRVFASTRPVEFAPRRAKDVTAAKQATDYVNYVFMQENSGFLLLQNAFKDALISKIGVFKWYTDVSTDVAEETYEQQDVASVNRISSMPGIEVVARYPDGEGIPDSMTGEPSETYTITIRRVVEHRRQIVECIPPEEFLVSRNARDIDTADFVGHRSLKTLSELVEMGFDRAEIEENGTTTASFQFNTEAITRNPDIALLTGHTVETEDKSMTRYLYIEGYFRIDKDGDGIAELRRVCMINDNCYILHDEVVDDIKMAVICPDPEPHRVIGSSIADQVMDLQEIKSNVVRNTLDSLAQTIHPRTVVVEGQVNMDDVLNVETGAVIRATQPGMIQELSSTFVGQQAMPIIAYLDDVRASRTGISKASQGLDPDVLQSTTKAAVTATISAAQERLEMVARIFAETGIKRLFRGLLKEVIQNQDEELVMQLRDEWVPIDPRSWDPNMGVIVNVGLGNASPEQKIQLLMMIAQKQEEIIQTAGPDNPIVDLKQARDTYAEILELSGIKDPTRYFKEVTPEALQQMQEMAGEQTPDPTELLAQVQAQQIQADIKIAQDKAILEAEKQRTADDRERDKMELDFWLRTQELELKYGTKLQVEQIYAMIQRDRDLQKMQLEQQRAALAAQQSQSMVQ